MRRRYLLCGRSGNPANNLFIATAGIVVCECRQMLAIAGDSDTASLAAYSWGNLRRLIRAGIVQYGVGPVLIRLGAHTLSMHSLRYCASLKTGVRRETWGCDITFLYSSFQKLDLN